MGWGIVGTIIFFTILHYVIKDSVEQGVFYALKRYDKEKNNGDEA